LTAMRIGIRTSAGGSAKIPQSPFLLGIADSSAGFMFRGDAGAARGIRKRYGDFSGGRKPVFLFEVNFKDRKQNPYKPAINLKNGSVRLKRGDFDCIVDTGTGAGRLEINPSQQSFDSFLRTLYSWILIRCGGCMLHSAGIVKNGKAYIFLGKSGAGKSTLSKLAAASSGCPAGRPALGIEVLSDEINLLRFEKGSFRVYGSPFWGEMRNEGRHGSWPVGGFFLLKKAKANRLGDCTKSEALRLLLRCLVNFDRSPETAGNVLRTAARLLANARFSRLEFTKKDAGFLELV